MTYSIKKKQLYAKQEVQEFVGIGHDTLANAANASFIPIDASVEFDADLEDRGANRTTFTKAPKVPGKSTGRVRVSLEMTASGNAASIDPQFQLLLRACGVRSSDMSYVIFDGTLADLAGPVPNPNRIIRHGTTFVGTSTPSGSTTGMVIGDVQLPPSAGNTVIYLARQEGLGAGTLATGDIVMTYKGAAWGTISSASIVSITNNGATGLWPHSTPLSNIVFDSTGLTGALVAGNVIQGATSGAFARVYRDQAAVANAVVYIESPQGHFAPGETLKILPAGTSIGILAVGDAQISCPTVSVGLNEDGVYSSFQGARGTATIKWLAGKKALFSFDMQGLWVATTDKLFVTGVTLGQHTPPTFRSSAMVFGPYSDDPTLVSAQGVAANFSPCVAAATLTLGNVLTQRECSNGSGGILGYVIDDRNPTLDIDPEQVPESGFSLINRMFTAALIRGTFNLGTVGPDKFIFGWPAGQIEQNPAGSRGNIATRNIKLGLTSGAQDTDTGDNEWWLIWQVA